MNELTDDEIMEHLLNGRSELIAELFHRYKHELFGFFFRMSNQKDTSEDLVQNVFVRILKYHKSYSSRNTFRSWLYQIARNVQYDYVQKKTYKIDDLEKIDVKEENTDTTSEKLDVLNEAFQLLNADQRELIILHRYQRLSYKEIAQLFNSTEGAIKVKMFRTLKELREFYHKIESNDE